MKSRPAVAPAASPRTSPPSMWTRTMTDTDRGYSILLSHLHKPTSTLPLPSLQSLITHFLAHAPNPTPLAAILVSSPLFRPFSHAKLTALTAAFRHSVHAKLVLLEAEEARAGLFARGVRAGLSDWVRAVVRGFAGGQGLMRFVGAGGILLGLEDVGSHVGMGPGSGGARARAEEEVVVALAEVMEVYGGSGWDTEFRQETEAGEVDVLSLSLIYASQFLPNVLPGRIKALPLATLSSHLLTTIDRTFLSGTFLPPAPLDSLTSSPLFASVAPIAKLTAKIIPLLVDARPHEGWPTMSDALVRLEILNAAVQRAWVRSAFATVEDESDLASNAREQAKTLWTVLKPLLFTTIMIAQSMLSTAVYTAPPSSSPHTPSNLAQTTLRSLAHLAFVISQFGGVTSTAGGGFAELKRVFYMALDVLAADATAAEAFVTGLLLEPHPSSKSGLAIGSPQTRANLAFALAAVEQLVPVLTLTTIERTVFPLCLPCLNDPTHRETYESAHSVVLSTFSAHPSSGNAPSSPTFVEKLVPFYARCLLENAGEGQLSTAQFRLAYAAVVRASEPVLAQYCVDLLVEEIDRVTASAESVEHAHRLRLALISTVSSLPLSLLPGVLTAISRNIADSDDARRTELVNALYTEMLERVGDREREYVMRWWVEWGGGERGKGKGKMREGMIARL